VADNMSIYNVIYVQIFAPKNWYKEGHPFITDPKFETIKAVSEKEAIEKVQEKIKKYDFEDKKGTTTNTVSSVEIFI
jgi:hypothetical protein